MRERIAAHEGAILCAATHPDGRLLVTGGDDGRLMQVGLDGHLALLASFGGEWVHALAASPASG